MKYLIPVLCAVALVVGCTKPVDVDQLEERDDGLSYLPNEEKPFTGVAVKKRPNGQKRLEVTWKDGKQHGLGTEWYENGQKSEEVTLKDGKPYGPYTRWYKDGQKSMEGTYKDFKKDGLWNRWYENGQKISEITYKDGKWLTATVWKPNGEKCPDTNLVNGTGVKCSYHENGQKRGEATYKDGKYISEKRWDEDGNQTE